MEKKLPRILLAEDDEIIAELFRLMLHSSVQDITIVSDGSYAVEQSREKEFDFIFMDIQMPVMDGIEATRTIRELQRSGRTKSISKIIGITASNDERDKQACLDAGMDMVLVKPFTHKDLEGAIMIND